MSDSFGFLGGPVAGNATAFPADLSWLDYLLPASFRGVPFQVRGASETSGRNAAVHQFIGRETAYVEDLGRKPTRFTVAGFVLGDDYAGQRNLLRQACLFTAGNGTLVHPSYGELTVNCLTFTAAEDLVEHARICRVSMEFVIAGDIASPVSVLDTAGNVLGLSAGTLADLSTAYSLAAEVTGNPAFVLAALQSGVASAATSMLGVSVGGVASVAAAIAPLAGSAAAPATTAAAVTAGFQAIGDAVVAAGPSPPDYSGGVAALAAWNGAVAPAAASTPARTVQAANARALTLLVQGAAVATAAAIYARVDFISASDAAAARTQLLGLLDGARELAADAAQAALVADFNALEAAVAADISARIQQLPILAAYRVGAPVPSLVLAQRLLQDPTQADSLAALNSAIHPGFMPASGVWLEAA
ncbi:MAG: DNA circularization N-terminal domain-containing protein [Xanthomonadaceae bacterium]|nr:DNA circularization N-terminal domain-containing protein [Xanthomonadaceae bacterium]